MLEASVKGEIGYFLLEHYPDNRDSVDYAVSLLKESLVGMKNDTTSRAFSLGYGYVRQGRIARGLDLMERMAAELDRQNDIEMASYAYTRLMETYSELKLYDRMARILPIYEARRDTFANMEKAEIAIAATSRMKAEHFREQNRLLADKLTLQNERMVMLYLITFLTVVLMTIALMAAMRRYRTSKQHIASLREHEAETKLRIATLETDLSARINSNHEILREPTLIVDDEQGKFRRAFNTLYPNFIKNLKADYPILTPNDELLCMLIYLGHTTDEIMIYLGISRASVNTARYRLRQKFKLAKDMGLNELIEQYKQRQ